MFKKIMEKIFGRRKSLKKNTKITIDGCESSNIVINGIEVEIEKKNICSKSTIIINGKKIN